MKRTLTAIKQLSKPFDAQAGIRNDSAQSTDAKLFVIRNHRTGIRAVAALDHMAAGLIPKNKAGALKRLTDFAAR